MRRVSKKMARLKRSVEEFRESFRQELKVCEWCGKRKPILHEISRGSADRKKSLDKRYAILGLCDPGCHQIVGDWPRARQLALLKIRRPQDYDLDAFHKIVARCWPYAEDIEREVSCLLKETEFVIQRQR